jgi:trigger factor
MEVTIEKINSTQAKLKVQVPAEIVSQRIDGYYANLAKRAKIPGFRPGKAPKVVVKQHYGKDSASDLIERLISEFTLKVVEERSLELLYPPKLIATDMPEETKAFNFEVEIDLRPEVPEVNWSDIQIESVEEKAVTDADIDEQVNILLDTEAVFEDAKSERPAQDNDHVTIKFVGSVDGKTAPELQSESQAFVLGKKYFLPEFEDAVRGLKVGEKKTFDLKFPADYHAEEYKGKVAQFEVELLQLKEKILPGLTDELAKTLNPNASSVPELRELIKKDLQEQRARIRTNTLRERVGDALAEKYTFDVNQRQVETLAERLAHEAHHMMHQMNIKHEETEEHLHALQESSKKKALRDVRVSYLLQKIAKEQKIEVKAADFEKRFEETSKKTGYSVAQIKSYYAGEDKDSTLSRMDRLRIDILDEKSLDYALSKATIKNKG